MYDKVGLSSNNDGRWLALSHRQRSQCCLGLAGSTSPFLPESSPVVDGMCCEAFSSLPWSRSHQGSRLVLLRGCLRQVLVHERARLRSIESHASAGCTSGGSWGRQIDTTKLLSSWSRLTLQLGKMGQQAGSLFESPSSSWSVQPSLTHSQVSFVRLRGRISPTCIA